MNEHQKIVDAFCKDCVWVWAVFDQYTRLFVSGEERVELLKVSAPTFFADLLEIYKSYLFVSV